MRKSAIFGIAAAMILGLFATSLNDANAGSRYYGHKRYYGHGGNTGAFVAGALIGLATTAIIASQTRPRYYYDDYHRGYHPRYRYRRHYRPRVYYAPRVHPRPVYRHRISRKNWRRHVRWCSNRYRTYNVHKNNYNSGRRGWRRCRSPYWR